MVFFLVCVFCDYCLVVYPREQQFVGTQDFSLEDSATNKTRKEERALEADFLLRLDSITKPIMRAKSTLGVRNGNG